MCPTGQTIFCIYATVGRYIKYDITLYPLLYRPLFLQEFVIFYFYLDRLQHIRAVQLTKDSKCNAGDIPTCCNVKATELLVSGNSDIGSSSKNNVD
ncbi:hypothetical protein H4Q26_005671 [Puccinia striiformis f. sp. tritici PST-130]|nr:hypothetical protein H4Q26_005671 [Puccinia striiformis f. sp. tritici PST-130]